MSRITNKYECYYGDKTIGYGRMTQTNQPPAKPARLGSLQPAPRTTHNYFSRSKSRWADRLG